MNHSACIVGIETTCDETGIGVVNDFKVQANIIISSAKQHIKTGGVVPEIAARSHEQNLINALEQANVVLTDITHIAYAANPGLPGCLHVGATFARTLSSLLKKPLLPINHLYAHIFSPLIDQDFAQLKLPALGLVVSGGHTALYLIKSVFDLELISQTTDDAIGEVYDKVGRAMGLDYPAGPKIDMLFNPKLVKQHYFFRSSTKWTKFSYSGLKSACFKKIEELCPKKSAKQNYNWCEFASCFQAVIIDHFLEHVKAAVKQCQPKSILLGGGVSANKYLREQISKLQLPYLLADKKYTSDNGAMIAFYANLLVNAKKN